MAILSDHDIQSLIQSGEVSITPVPSPRALSPSAIDLTLAQRFEVPRALGGSAVSLSIDSRDSRAVMEALDTYTQQLTIEEGRPFDLAPGAFALAWTRETIRLPNWLAARVEGRSTLARLGLSVHQSAPTVHSTFNGALQLELSNAGPFTIQLYPGQRICQLILETMSSPSAGTLESVHQFQSHE